MKHTTHDACLRDHVRKLRALLKKEGFAIYSEHGVEPAGWVNVHCKECGLVHEVALVRR